MDASNEKIKSDIICSSYGETSDCTLFFILNLQTSSFSYVKILPESSYLKKVTNVGKKINFNGKEQLEVKINQKFGIKIKKDLKNFLIFNKRGNFPFKLSYNYYKSYFYKAFDLDQRSGNYVFRPTNDSFDKIMYGSPEEATLYKGENIIQISVMHL